MCTYGDKYTSGTSENAISSSQTAVEGGREPAAGSSSDAAGDTVTNTPTKSSRLTYHTFIISIQLHAQGFSARDKLCLHTVGRKSTNHISTIYIYIYIYIHTYIGR
jgi:hypothetical protein